MNKKPILVVLTGGTIQSSSNHEIIDIDLNKGQYLIDMYHKHYKSDCLFEIVQPIFMLSENLSLTNWNQLIAYLKTVSFEQYQGVIITHGSDTLAYTSCMLGLLLGHIELPIMITASNYVLDDPRSNGLGNFAACVNIIESHKHHPAFSHGGVFCVYRDHTGTFPIYRATHILPADCIQDQFSDCNREPYATLTQASTDNPTHFSLTVLSASRPVHESSKQICQKIWNQINPDKPFFQNPICMLMAYPGFSYEYTKSIFNIQHKPAAILHVLYHSGTLCNSGTDYERFDVFAQQCRQHNLPVYLCSQKEHTSQYASVADLDESFLNIIHPLYQISPVAAYCKLLIAYNQTYCTPVEYMKHNLSYEIIHSETALE